MNKPPTPDEHTEIRKLLGLDKRRGVGVLTRNLVIAAGLGALALLAVATVSLRSGSSSERSFVVEPAKRSDLTVIITATGSVQPTNKVDVSSELSGTVRTVLVDHNSTVKVGQVLAELERRSTAPAPSCSQPEPKCGIPKRR